jgi:signal transduction histidine kinase
MEEGPATLSPVDVSTILSKAAFDVDRDGQDKQLKIDTHMKPGDFTVEADVYLYDVFYNLLHNSVRFDDNEIVSVEVSAKLEGEQLRIVIADYGRGIPDNSKELLFARISKKKEGFWGTGLGLTLIKQIIDRYNGRVWIEDRVPGDHTKGASITMTLPIAL